MSYLWSDVRELSSRLLSTIPLFRRATQYSPLDGDGSAGGEGCVLLDDLHEGHGNNAESDVEDVTRHLRRIRGEEGRWRTVHSSSKYLRFLLPSFLGQRATRARRGKLHPTAWLDGLRGIASLLVVIHHTTIATLPWSIHTGWTPSGPQTAWLIRLPILRLLIAGPPQVAIFFVVSGYALSHKSLTLARAGRFADVASTLESAAFRRHPRLFLPAGMVTLCTAMLVQLGGAGWFPTQGVPGAAGATRVVPRMEGWVAQLGHWWGVQVDMTVPIYAQGVEPSKGNPYDANQWTLPMEYVSSLVVFMFLAAFARVKDRVRMATALGVCVYIQWYFAYLAVFPFLCGMLICDLHLEIDKVKSKAGAAPGGVVGVGVGGARRFRHGRAVVGVPAFLFALWLVGCVSDGWSYTTLSSWEPEKNRDGLWVPVGAACLVLVVDQAPILHSIFTNSFVQYLGRISYALYLVHGPLLWSVGVRFALFGLRVTGWQQELVGIKTGGGGGNSEDDIAVRYNTQWVLGILLAACLWWPITIYAADLTARHFDENCVMFTKWVYEKVCKEESKST